LPHRLFQPFEWHTDVRLRASLCAYGILSALLLWGTSVGAVRDNTTGMLLTIVIFITILSAIGQRFGSRLFAWLFAISAMFQAALACFGACILFATSRLLYFPALAIFGAVWFVIAARLLRALWSNGNDGDCQ
jgi:hypothetical protein